MIKHPFTFFTDRIFAFNEKSVPKCSVERDPAISKPEFEAGLRESLKFLDRPEPQPAPKLPSRGGEYTRRQGDR
jgi:hypothetical protein